MKKEELRKLRSLTATKEMMAKAKITITEKETYWGGKEYIRKRPLYEVFTRIQKLSGYIKIALFLPDWMKIGIKTPRYEIFVNEVGGEWITRELDMKGKEVGWKEAMICNLDGIELSRYVYCGLKENPIYYPKDGIFNLKCLPAKENVKGLARLQYWQQAQRNEETKRKEEREQAPWDAENSKVPQIVDGFEEWMRKQGKNQYIFYDYKPNQDVGYCSRCKHTVKIKYPKHDKDTKCPNCKTLAIFKASGKIQTLSTGWYWAQIIQKIPDGIVIRHYSQRVWYRDCKYTNPKIKTNEEARVFMYNDGTVHRYLWGTYKNKKTRWIPTNNINWNNTILYRKNLRTIMKEPLLKYSAIDLWPRLHWPASEYLKIEAGNPAIEKLARIGMFKLAEDIANTRYDVNLIDQEANELTKMIKIDKSRLERLKAIEGNITALKWYQKEKRENTIWPDEVIKGMAKAGFLESDFYFIDFKMSTVKIYNYLVKQSVLMNESLRQVVITWRDYLSMARNLKMNTKLEQIGKPKDLKYSHDELIMMRDAKNMKKEAAVIEKKWPKVAEHLERIQKFEFKKGEYEIVAPKSVLDIVKEGMILRHCVHTCDYYFSRIQTDESYLFFLRKTSHKEMPWYTLEVEPSGNIRQKRTTGDNQNADFDLAKDFLKEWQKYFKKQLTKEEKELGVKADELRKKNYEELRKNGNKIWHGKLAGQLLADVLEKDFMEAM